MINSGDIDHAWLVSRGGFTPDSRNAAQAGRKLKAFTFAEFQRRLLLIDEYLHDLVRCYDESQLNNYYYIAPETIEGADIKSVVFDWLREDNVPPLFVLAPYCR